MEIKKNVSLKPYNSWAVGGAAEYFVQPRNIEELKEALIWSKKMDENTTVLGSGSNVLISDQGINGLVISLNKMNSLHVKERADVINIEAEAGALKSDLFKIFYKLKLLPAVFLVGIPGNIAGGIVMNAGIGEKNYPYQFSDIVSWVEVLNLKEEKKNLTFTKKKAIRILNPIKNNFNSSFEIKKIKASQVKWLYRDSQGWQPGIITRAGFSWPNKKILNLSKSVKERSKKRFKTQPLQELSCGSVFKNPTKYTSGALIEKVGLKGFSLGGAKISDQHANFILNASKRAFAKDIHELICLVKKQVKEKVGISLQTEVKYMGQW